MPTFKLYRRWLGHREFDPEHAVPVTCTSEIAALAHAWRFRRTYEPIFIERPDGSRIEKLEIEGAFVDRQAEIRVQPIVW